MFTISSPFWIGSKKKNNVWYWNNNNRVIESSMHWSPDEPNNAKLNENCAEILVDNGVKGEKSTFLSNDRPCTHKSQALCEKQI